MLTPPVVNKIPYGLLNYFGIQSGGENPHSIDANISPSVDVWTFYNWRDRQCALGSANFSAVGSTVAVPVSAFAPVFASSGFVNSGFAVQVHRIGLVLTNPAGVTAMAGAIKVERQLNNAATGLFGLALAQTPTIAGAIATTATWQGDDLILRNGERILAACTNYAGAGNTNADLMMEYTVLPMF